MREFETGATRNPDGDKLDFEGFFSPLTMEAYAKVMHFNRRLENGSMRDADNWQLGIPLTAYIKSGWRHFFDWWKGHRGYQTEQGIVFDTVSLMFNAQGYLHELIKKDPGIVDRAIAQMTEKRNAMWSRNALSKGQ